MEERLGVGRVLSGTFGLFFRKLYILWPLALVPYLIFAAVQSALLADFDPLAGVGANFFGATYIIVQILGVLLGFWVGAVVTLAALDLQAGKSMRVGYYLSRGVSALPAIVVLTIVFGVIIAVPFFAAYGLLWVLGVNVLDGAFVPDSAAIATIFLVVTLPFIAMVYLGARYGLYATIILAEQAGLSALSRASELTQGRRWGVAGAYLLTILCFVIFAFIILFVLGFVFAFGASSGASADFLTPGPLMFFLFNAMGAMLNAVSIAFLSAFLAVVYTRLRLVREGGDVGELSTVFE